MANTLPWHAGELALQARVGALDKMRDIGGRFIRDYMPDQHRSFFAQLPFIVVGAVDQAGRPWATLRAGPPGFLAAPDPRRLDLDIAREAADPADAGLEDGQAVGLLGMELSTRRRNRLNGILRHARGRISHVDVIHSYGNCARYIHPRIWEWTRAPIVSTALAPQAFEVLDAPARALIARSRSFFVASYAVMPDGGRQVDVSHRGGDAGFVRLDADGGMTIPDYNGNRFFNTLGNMMLNPMAGLAFVDFDSGDLLQMTGRTEVILEGPEIGRFEGAERLWRFLPERVVRRPQALPLRWRSAD